MQWQAPEFTEIEMNAEIGAYTREPEPASEPTAETADPQAAPRPAADAQSNGGAASSRG
jgi:hypothetical protein